MENLNIPTRDVATFSYFSQSEPELFAVLSKVEKRRNVQHPTGLVISILKSGEMKDSQAVLNEDRDVLRAKVQLSHGKVSLTAKSTVQGDYVRIWFHRGDQFELTFDLNSLEDLKKAVKILRSNGLIKKPASCPAG